MSHGVVWNETWTHILVWIDNSGLENARLSHFLRNLLDLPNTQMTMMRLSVKYFGIYCNGLAMRVHLRRDDFHCKKWGCVGREGWTVRKRRRETTMTKEETAAKNWVMIPKRSLSLSQDKSWEAVLFFMWGQNGWGQQFSHFIMDFV